MAFLLFLKYDFGALQQIAKTVQKHLQIAGIAVDELLDIEKAPTTTKGDERGNLLDDLDSAILPYKKPNAACSKGQRASGKRPNIKHQ